MRRVQEIQPEQKLIRTTQTSRGQIEEQKADGPQATPSHRLREAEPREIAAALGPIRKKRHQHQALLDGLLSQHPPAAAVDNAIDLSSYPQPDALDRAPPALLCSARK